jgi:hypothetical protein
MEPINNFQVGNYVQYQSQSINNGQIAMIVDRISSINDKQITTEKGLTIAIGLAKSQFLPISIEPEWLQAIGFEKHCKEGVFSIWEQMFYYLDKDKPITIIIIEHNENKLFFLGLVNEPLYAHSLQNLFFNITGNRLDLPIKL